VESSFRLGRIAGVDVGMNRSWLVVFALITCPADLAPAIEHAVAGGGRSRWE
jgi:hypothetical protein